MNDDQVKQMSREGENRIYNLEEKMRNGESISLEEVFRFNDPQKVLGSRKVLVPSFDEGRILTDYPFNEKVYFTVCPQCRCVEDASLLIPLLETGDVIPILRGEYFHYDIDFIEEIIGFPHIIIQEYRFFKKLRLLQDAESRLCPHCVGERFDDIKNLVDDEDILIKAERIIDNLWPWINPDFELIDKLIKSVKDQNAHLFSQIKDLSITVKRLRDKQAYDATGSLPLSNLSNIKKVDLENISGIDSGEDMIEIKNTAAKAVGIEVPVNMSNDNFVETVQPHKDKLISVTDKIIDESKDGDVVSFDKLREETENINYQIRKAFGSTKFKAYRATKQTVSSNKALLGTIFLGGLFGAVDSFTGCGLTIAGGAGIEGIKKYADLKTPKSLKEVGTVMHSTV